MDDAQVLQQKEIEKYSVTKNYSTSIIMKTLYQVVWLDVAKQQSCMGVYNTEIILIPSVTVPIFPHGLLIEVLYIIYCFTIHMYIV